MAAPPDGEDLATLIARIDEACRGTSRPLDAHERLGVTQVEFETPIGAIGAAFLYIEARNEPATPTEYFGPIAQIGDVSNPPAVAEMPDWVVDTWEICAGLVTEPVARARLHDLCFVLRRGNGRDHAAAAIGAYAELADLYPSTDSQEIEKIQVALGATRSLRRALDLARRTRQNGLADQVIQLLVTAAHHSLHDEESGAGVVFGFIEPLVHDGQSILELDGLLRLARDRYRDDLWHTLTAIDLQMRMPDVDNSLREVLRTQEIEALFLAADTAAPVVAMIHLQDAAKRAGDHGLRPLRDEATRRLQALSGEDLGLVEHKVEMTIPAEAVEATIEQYAGASNWHEALHRLLASEPPSGRVEQNRAFTADLVNEHPLLTLFPVTKIGQDGLPRHTAGSDEEKAAHRLAETELQRLQMLGGIYVAILERIWERFGPIGDDDLIQFLAQNSHVSHELAAAIARSIGRYLAGDYEGATFTIVPRIERVCRELLLKMRAPVFRPASGGVPGQYPGLGAMLGMLEDRGLDSSWERFLGTFLTRQEGMNYRNELLHGSVDHVNVGVACYSIIAALYLAVGVGFVEDTD
jgi:hypothetical protein